jgi:aspartyl-tRNA(Asn)/glutamyl-tRNA(Gln) amidotransferase subunit A
MGAILSRPVLEIAHALREGEVRAQDLVEAAIANHDRFGAALNAYLLWTPARARKSAEAADAAFASGASAGPLQGLPISIKDLFAAEGLPTFAGSNRRLPPDWERDGPVVATLRRQLGIIMGKTHMVEFAFGGTGANSHWGAPRNPWDAKLHRSPGGSSSGAGVSLAEGSALMALGSDTAGSVRIPAAMTGQVGLKVTLGRWSAEGVVPLCPTFDTPGLLTRSVADAAYGFAALDPTTPDAERFIARIAGRSISGLRIGIGDPLLWNECEPGIAEGVKDALDTFAQQGAVLREALVPEAAIAYGVFLEGGLSGIELRGFLDHALPNWIPELDPMIAPLVLNAEKLGATTYLARLWRLKAASRAVLARFAGVDVLASPTLCLTPPAMAEIGAENGWQINRRFVRNTVWVNYLGLCGITMPVARDRAGMPVGLQFIAPPGNEERLIAAALAAERVLGTGSQRLGLPPLVQ